MTIAPTRLRIATEFSATPGPRNRMEGEFSGEAFLETLLRPRFLDARQADQQLLVDLDGADGYPTSFLEESFGGLAMDFGSKEVLRIVQIKCDDEPYLIDEIKGYIREASSATPIAVRSR